MSEGEQDQQQPDGSLPTASILYLPYAIFGTPARNGGRDDDQMMFSPMPMPMDTTDTGTIGGDATNMNGSAMMSPHPSSLTPFLPQLPAPATKFLNIHLDWYPDHIVKCSVPATEQTTEDWLYDFIIRTPVDCLRPILDQYDAQSVELSLGPFYSVGLQISVDTDTTEINASNKQILRLALQSTSTTGHILQPSDSLYDLIDSEQRQEGVKVICLGVGPWGRTTVPKRFRPRRRRRPHVLYIQGENIMEEVAEPPAKRRRIQQTPTKSPYNNNDMYTTVSTNAAPVQAKTATTPKPAGTAKKSSKADTIATKKSDGKKDEAKENVVAKSKVKGSQKSKAKVKDDESPMSNKSTTSGSESSQSSKKQSKKNTSASEDDDADDDDDSKSQNSESQDDDQSATSKSDDADDDSKSQNSESQDDDQSATSKSDDADDDSKSQNSESQDDDQSATSKADDDDDDSKSQNSESQDDDQSASSKSGDDDDDSKSDNSESQDDDQSATSKSDDDDDDSKSEKGESEDDDPSVISNGLKLPQQQQQKPKKPSKVPSTIPCRWRGVPNDHTPTVS
jgi:hypothetical protein